MMKLLKIFGLFLCVALLILAFRIVITSNTLETKNSLQTEESQNNIKILKTEDIQIASGDRFTSPPVCFQGLPSDSNLFRFTTAINDKYIAIEV
ncbi:MAG: hypothetical protein Tsb0014_37630 [Pleurocapsa sp.]